MSAYMHLLLSVFILGISVSGDHLVPRDRDRHRRGADEDRDRDRPGCRLGTFHPVGHRWYTSGHDGCLKYTCERSGVVSSQPCPRVAVPLGCSLVDGDQNAEYPECCPRRECAVSNFESNAVSAMGSEIPEDGVIPGSSSNSSSSSPSSPSSDSSSSKPSSSSSRLDTPSSNTTSSSSNSSNSQQVAADKKEVEAEAPKL